MKATIKLNQEQLVDIVRVHIKDKANYTPTDQEIKVIITPADDNPCHYNPAYVTIEVEVIL